MTPDSDNKEEGLQAYFQSLARFTPTNGYDIVTFTIEKPILIAVMKQAKNDHAIAAKILGIDITVLHRKLRVHKLL